MAQAQIQDVAPGPTHQPRSYWSRLRTWVKVVIIVVAVLVVLGIVGSLTNGGVNTSSISYRDGHYIGSINYNPLDPSTTSWYTTFCHQLVANGMPASDTESEWVAGCVDGMSQAGFEAQHPGGNSGSSGNTGGQ
jgi:hypothetical protein